MSVKILKREDKSTLKNIEACKSKSMITGQLLRQSHYELGKTLANEIMNNEGNSFVVLVMMRAGIFFANGIADQIEIKGGTAPLVLVTNDIISMKDYNIIDQKKVLIVDAVINTGKSIFKIIDQLKKNNEIIIATTVIPETSLILFPEYSLYTVRTSNNKYKGAKVKSIKNGKGPDTGDRLFNTLNPNNNVFN